MTTHPWGLLIATLRGGSSWRDTAETGKIQILEDQTMAARCVFISRLARR